MCEDKVAVSGTEKFSPYLLKRKKRRMKWLNRIRQGLRLTAVVVIITLLFLIYRWGTYFYFEKSGKNFQFMRAAATLAELYGDGTKVDEEVAMVKVSTLLKQSLTTKVYRQVGEWSVITGELHAEKSLFGELRYKIHETPEYLRRTRPASFHFPMSLINEDGDRIRNERQGAIEQLSHIGDGFVAEMNFSIIKGMSPRQLAEMLSEYDLWITGMAMYSGEFKDVVISNFSSSGGSMFVPHLTLRPIVSYSEDGLGRGETLSLSSMAIDTAADQMLEDLEWLTTYVNYNGVDMDKQRLAYLKNNGVLVYGASVTGPVRELEKLKEEQVFHSFELGQVEIWNWK